MAHKTQQPSLLEPAKPPLDERRIAELRRNPAVRVYDNPDPNPIWSYEPVLQVIEPVSAHDLIGRDDDKIA
jgi:hypothetical protein